MPELCGGAQQRTRWVAKLAMHPSQFWGAAHTLEKADPPPNKTICRAADQSAMEMAIGNGLLRDALNSSRGPKCSRPPLGQVHFHGRKSSMNTPRTRASAISFTSAEKLEKDRVPGRTSEVTVNEVLSPKASARTKAAAPLTMAAGWRYLLLSSASQFASTSELTRIPKP